MIKVAIVGTGNMSHHLNKVITNANDTSVVQIINSRKKIQENTANIPDIYIIAVSDDAINTVAKQLKNTKSLVVHTSGSISIDSLPMNIRRGVFYPLQTFSKQSEVNFKKVPICLEVEKHDDMILLKKLANALSDFVYEISSEQRKSIHLAAVFVNNFTNHLYHIANEICDENQVPFKILKPLITETAQKIESLSPIEVQTGPAKRNDNETIKKHLNQLKNKEYKKLYTVLTKSIQETHGKKL